MALSRTITAEIIETKEQGFSFFDLKKIIAVSLPLVLTELSAAFMVFSDRVILAHYDTEAMVAATAAANVFLIFQFGLMAIAMIAEVFVAQCHGAKAFDKISKPVWQMIWFSLLSAFFLIPFALINPDWLFASEYHQYAKPYFKWLMIFGATFPLTAAIAAFFVGMSQIKIVLKAALIGNAFNLFLSYALVNGFGFFPALGIEGAAIATGVSNLLMTLLLLSKFLNKENRLRYHTHRASLDLNMMFRCIKVGFPNALGHMSSAAAWALVLYVLSKKSFDHVFVMSFGFTLWTFCHFIAEGLGRGVSILAAQRLGANRRYELKTLLLQGLSLEFMFVMMLGIPFLMFPNFWVDLLLPYHTESLQNHEALSALISASCFWIWLAILFDGLLWVVDGILTALGDTRFMMILHSVGTWVFYLAPLFLLLLWVENAPVMTLQVTALFCVSMFCAYVVRFAYNEKHKKVYLKVAKAM